MLEAATVVALVAALICVAAAVLQSVRARRPSRPGAKYPSESGARQARAVAGVGPFLVAAFAFVSLAAGAALVDDKVGDARAAPNTAPAAEDSSWPLAHLDAFRGNPSLHAGRLSRPLCLVRYYGRRVERDPGATWWTTCDENRRLPTISAVRRRLALPRAWGRRDARIFARIPAGETVVYLRGRAAPQCEPGGSACFPGGGVQLLFRDDDFHRAWFQKFECTRAAERVPARFVPCAG